MEEKNDDTIISTSEEEIVTPAETIEPEEEESIEDLKAKLEEERQAREKADKNYNDQRIRAEKAERNGKVVAPKPLEKKGDLSTKDLYALMNAKVAEEDVDEVVEYAKFKKIEVKDALNSSVVKTLLADKAEMRRTAEATSTGSTRRSSGKVSDDTLVNNASKGVMPDSDDEIERLISARRQRKN